MSDDTVDRMSNDENWLWYQNVDSHLGRALWVLSDHPRSNQVAGWIGVGWVVLFVWLAIGTGQPLPVSVVLAAIALAGFIIATTVSSMASDILCPECGYRTEPSYLHCPSCGGRLTFDD